MCSCTKWTRTSRAHWFWSSTWTTVRSCSSYLVWLITPCCHRKTLPNSVLLRFDFHDVTWKWSFPRPDGVSELHEQRVHAAPAVLAMNVQQWIVLSLKIWLSLSLHLFRIFGCNLISLLPSVAYSAHPQNSFLSSLGWVSSFLIALLTEKKERQQVFNRISNSDTSTLCSISGIESGWIFLLTFG